MKIYFVRHAQSKQNARQGNSDGDPELTEVGIEQAKRIGSYFHNIKLKQIYCSQLKRAKATFEKIKPYMKDTPFLYTKEIIEHDIGIYNKKGFDDWTSYVKDAKKSGNEFKSFKPKNGESFDDTYKRAGEFLKKLLKKHSKKDSILLVSHGRFGNYFILNALRLKIEEGIYFNLSNASVSMLNIKKNGKVKDYNINDYNHIIREAVKQQNK